MNLVQKIAAARAGGSVERCHGIPHHGSYSNGKHSWNCLILLWHLFPEHWSRLSGYVMVHDVPEFVFGDIPSPVKRYSGIFHKVEQAEDNYLRDIGLPTMSSLTEEEIEIFDACDKLELYLWCREQEFLGNNHVRSWIVQLDGYFIEAPLPNAARVFFRELNSGEDLMPSALGLARKYLEEVK